MGWEPGPECRVSGMPFYPTYTKVSFRKKRCARNALLVCHVPNGGCANMMFFK